ATRRSPLRGFPGSCHLPFDPRAVFGGPLHLPTPDADLLLSGLFLVRVVLGEQSGLGEGETRAHEPLRDVLISDQARAELAPSIVAARDPARHRLPPHALAQHRTSSNTATPAVITGNQAALFGIWRLDPCEADFRAIDAQDVASDGLCPASDGSAEQTRRSGGGHQLARSPQDHPSTAHHNRY